MLFAKIAGVRAASRLALRYINELSIPWKEGDAFETYLAAPPTLPEIIPQHISEFQTVCSAHDEATGIGVNITQRKRGGPGNLLLDIDVYRVGPFLAHDDKNIESVFESLHEMKNRVFFNMVTEKCLQLFQ